MQRSDLQASCTPISRTTNVGKTDFRSTYRLLLAIVVVLVAGATGVFASCPTGAGVSGVDIAFIDLDSNGIPDIESSDKERNERARISSSLATKLGLAVPAGADVFPQIRVIAPSLDLDDDPVDVQAGTGVFSVYEVFSGTTDEVQVWADEDASDDESGEYRLFEESTPADLSTITVIVHAQAPSRTSVRVDGGAWVDTDHFCEPGESYLVDSADLYADKRFALLVPHGGEIEARTSEQVVPIAAALRDHGIDANVWDVQADWFSGTDESEHWHITSSEVSEDGFPGLAEMVDAADFDAGRAFQYAASLHGMSFSKEGLVIGGRAHREAKCLVGVRVRERMAAEGLAVPAVYVWNVDKVLADSVEVPHGDGTTTITGERGSDPGLSGTSRDNVVNRLSPNENGDAGFGGFQIEQSPALRAVASYRDLVATEIAGAFAELIAKPDLFDPNGTAICDALENGGPAPTAEIRGRAWWDAGGDHVQNGVSEPGVENAPVDLLDATGSTVLASTVTDADGRYAFPRLAAGTYRVRVNASSALAFVFANQGGDDALDSDVDPTGLTAALTVDPHALVDDVDAGLTRVVGGATLGDYAWVDTVGNHVQDAGDDPLAGIAVELLDGNWVPLDSTLTDSGGFYVFDDLPPGAYVVRFVPPAGYEPVAADQGGDDALDSDIGANFEQSVLIFDNGATILDLDAGFTTSCQDATLVAFGSEWRWSTTLDTDWNQLAYVEPQGAWTEDQASLGYGLSVESTLGDTSTTVVYARLELEIEDPTLFDAVDLSLLRNDGAVVYLNGTEVLRSNVPVSGAGSATVDQEVTSPGFVQGTNLLAVEIHRTASPASLAFDLEVSSRVCRPCVERVEIPADRVTYVRHESSSNRGDRLVAQMDADTEENALFSWPVDATLPADAEVLHASILWRVVDDSSDTFHLYPVEASWDEATADWYRRSDSPLLEWQTAGVHHATLDYAAGTPLASFRFDDSDFGAPPFLGRVVLNVGGRALVQAWARGEHGEHGVLVPGEGGGNKLAVDSNDVDEELDPDVLVPTLEVVYRSCGN